MHSIEQLNSALTGRYEIERRVGQGGMATVYLARDLRHNRKVALKVLSAELAAVLGRERFLAEIETTANLQHPHLLPLFDSGEIGGLLFYVMPFVQGETLRKLLERERQLAVDDAIHIATAIGSALDYAHRHGVIHRDLKPENILMHERDPLVMDFGIALAVSNAGGTRVTQSGISLGTPQYMSPEQATGDRQVDGRSDIYSLGAVLYEMLAGEPPHVGTSVHAIIAKVITDRPRSIRASRDTVPEYVELAVMRALAKLPADRFSTAAEFVDAISGTKALTVPGMRSTVVHRGEVRDLPIVPVRPYRPSRLAAAVGVIAIAAAATTGAMAVRALRAPVLDPPARFPIALPDSLALSNSTGRQVALARDGSRAAFMLGFPGPLYTRRSGELQFDPIPLSDSARAVVISPDGRHVLFWVFAENPATAQLMKLPVDGGSPVKLADSASGVSQASWGDGGQVLFRRRDHLVVISADGGAERVAARPDTSKGQTALGWPELLPGEKAALVTIHHGPGNNPDSLYLGVVFLDDGRVEDLNVRGLTPHYASGHLLYVRQDGQLIALPFDRSKGRVTGDAMVIAKDVSARASGRGGSNARGVTDLAVSETGTILFTDGGVSFTGGFGGGPGRRGGPRRGGVGNDWWITVRHVKEGASAAVTTRSGAYREVRASPDGQRLALTIQDPVDASRENVWLLHIASDQLTQLTRNGMSSRPVWSPDGRRVIYRVTDQSRKPAIRFFSIPWDQSETPQPVLGADGAEDIEFPGPLGKYVAYVRGDSAATSSGTTNSDIFIAPIDSPQALRPFAATEIRERMPRFSPNGKWLAFNGHELSRSGGRETASGSILYVRPVPGPGALTKVSIDGGIAPMWSSDGKTLYYFSGGGSAPVIAARISEANGFQVVKRDTAFRRTPPQNSFALSDARSLSDIMPNGDIVYVTAVPPQVTAIVTGQAPPPTPVYTSNLIAIVNWRGLAVTSRPR
ncbi:MAG TPA: protein kinase [Gemmatimonadaceae bacterium]